MGVEAPALRRHEPDPQRRLHLGERDPLLEQSLGAPGGPEGHAGPVEHPERGGPRLAEQPPGKWQGHPRADPGNDRQGRRERGEKHPPPGHRPLAFTVKTPPSLRPYTAGLNISSAYAGGRTNTPGVVARAT